MGRPRHGRAPSRWPRGARALGVAAGLAVPGFASAWPGAGPNTWINPGALLSWTFGEGGGFGLGAELSLMHFRDRPVGAGGFAQLEWLRHRSGADLRGAAGVQAWSVAGAELGWAFQRGREGVGHGPHLGAFGSAGFVSLAVRGTLPHWGERTPSNLGVALKLGLPIHATEGLRPLADMLWPDTPGRPYREGDGRLRSPLLAFDSAPPVFVDCAAGLAEAERETLRDHWLHAASAEDASVPAFIRLAGDLAVVGAPPGLVAACLDAAVDESIHAAICFALAGAYGGRRFGAGAFEAPAGSVAHRAACRTGELVRLAVESFEDGCLNEGAAAAQAAAAAEGARHRAVRESLERIAVDESRHASLAWAVLGWCLSEAEAAVRDALRVSLRQAADRPASPIVPGAGNEGHGLLGSAHEAAIARRVATESMGRLEALLPA